MPLQKERTHWLRWQNDDLLLHVRVQPKAGQEGFAGPYGNEMKIRVNAPPVDGKANKQLLRFLAKAFGIPQRQVIIESGSTARSKLIRIKTPKSIPLELQEVIQHS